MLYAFTYTFLWNMTHSALACVLLHASYNTAIGVMILRPDSELEKGTYVLLQTCLNLTPLAVAIALVYFTRGRLGQAYQTLHGSRSTDTSSGGPWENPPTSVLPERRRESHDGDRRLEYGR